MLKKTITYHDLDGHLLTEDFYFNLNKAEMAEMVLSHDGDIVTSLQKIVADGNGAKIIEVFKDIMRRSYGRRSENGKSFIKKDEFFDEFVGTEAYDIMFYDLVTSGPASAEFIKAVFPADLIAKMQDELPAGTDAVVDSQGEPKRPQDMTREELLAAFKAKNES